MTTDTPKFKYDVAISFLQQDEALAIELNNVLKERMSTFISIVRQKEVAGKDGEEELNRAFAAESRIVAVLYRDGWGETPWTRIEANAIRNRACEHGYDFTTFILLGSSPTPPKWLPRTRIWVPFNGYGVERAASVIEARVQEAGGTPRTETVEEHEARIEHQTATEEARDRFLNSPEGVQAACEEASSFFSEVEKVCKSVSEETHIKFAKHRAHDGLSIFTAGLTLALNWFYRFRDTLDESRLNMGIWRSKVGFPNTFQFENPERLQSFTFRFDRTDMGQYRWEEIGGNEQSFSSKQLTEFTMKEFLNALHA